MSVPNGKRLNELTATEIVKGVSAGSLTCEAVVRACLEHIAEREPSVAAWTHLAADKAIEAAKEMDRTGRRGPLAGVPFGVKDIIDTADMPTEWGSPIHKGRQAGRDAACVALSRKAGGILLGKTVTSEFANTTPGKSRNPRDVTRTPGGSSNGSAAAVGADMVPLAIGTQTTGSTIRPSSFCGIVGYRPTYGIHRLGGTMEASGSVDTLGICARSIEDVALYSDVLMGVEPQPVVEVTTAPRIAFCRTHIWSEVDPATQKLVEGAAEQLAKAGARVTELELPKEFEGLTEAHRWITGFEFARTYTWELENHREEISQALRDQRIADGLACPPDRYIRSLKLAESCRVRMDAIWDDYDVIMHPSATAEAPVGWDHLRGANLYKMWTVLHVPALSLPVFTGPNGMPIGLQFFGKRYEDRKLFANGAWAWRELS